MTKCDGWTGSCIRCKAKAVEWTGHVTDEKGKKITAGWWARPPIR